MKRKSRFWEEKPLSRMTPDEWNSLCDGCGKCCLNKLEDEDTGDIHYTNVACRLLDLDHIRCTRFEERTRLVPDCTVLTSGNLSSLGWLPTTCAYRLIFEGKPLPTWHHLISGSAESIHEVGRSIRGKCISERVAGNFENHLIDIEKLDG